MLQTDAVEPEADLTRPVSPCFEHDFSRIPTHPPSTGAIQTKLAINEPGDSYERDADRMADQVMLTPEPQLQRACPCGGGCPSCHTEQPAREHESLQTKRVEAGETGRIAAPPIAHEVLRSSGQPLDSATRAFMEPRFGYNFSRVRVHLGGLAEKSARDVNAHAYTVGHDIVFGAHRFAPEVHEGRRLIAHELTHVVQQYTTGPRLARSPDGKGAALGVLTEQQAAEIETKYKAFKVMYFYGLTLTDRLTDDEVAQIESRINLLRQVQKTYYDGGLNTEGSIVVHLIGELRSRLLMNKHLHEMDPTGERERWNNLSEADKNYERMTKNHPEWRVKSNITLDMTDSIVKESQSTDVAVFQAAIIGAITAFAMSPKGAPPSPPATPGPLISRIAAFTGTRAQFRAWVLSKLQREPSNPLRFLLNADGTDFKEVSSRAHSELIDNPDVWEAGHIASDKLGGNRLMIQSAWENQAQNITVEHPRVGGAILDNPAIEVGGFPVAKSTVLWWEQTGHVSAGTAARAPVIQ